MAGHTRPGKSFTEMPNDPFSPQVLMVMSWENGLPDRHPAVWDEAPPPAAGNLP